MAEIGIAGLVLAAFPVAIEGLKQLQSAVKKVQSWKKYQEIVDNHRRLLGGEYSRYQNTIEKLFNGIITDEENRAMRANPQLLSVLVIRHDLRLRERLDHDFEDFVSDLEYMREALKTFREELPVDPVTGKTLSGDRSWLKTFRTIAKVMLSNKTYEVVLTRIEKLNSNLAARLSGGIDLEPQRRDFQSKRIANRVATFRGYARSLYNLLGSRENWGCKCPKGHFASLLLEQPQWLGDGTNTIVEIIPLEFRVMLSATSVDENGQNSLNLYGLAIDSNLDSPVQSSLDSFHHTVPSTGRPNDICSIIRDPKATERPIRLPTADDYAGPRLSVKVTHKIEQYLAQSSVSLKSILNMREDKENGLEFGREECLYTALTLASTVLHVHGTAWIANQWGSKDILFLSSDNSNRTDSKLNISDPFVSHQVPNQGASRAVKRKAPFTDSRHVVNAGLIGLGNILIELCLGISFEELTALVTKVLGPRDKADLTHEYLVDKVKLKIGNSYGKVVERCFRFPLGEREQDLDDEQFSLAVLENIVVPLKRELDLERSKGPERDLAGSHGLGAKEMDT